MGSSKVVVTGGAGFIGSHLAEALLAAGHTVTIIDNLASGFVENVPAGVTLIQASATDPAQTAAAVAGADLVYHLAAVASVQASIDDPLASHAACCTSALVVGDAARKAGVRRVVYAASASAYGIPAGPVQTENEPLAPRSTYAAGKLAGEMHLLALGETHGLETVRLRFFNVYGPRQRADSPYSGVIALFANALLAGRTPTILGDGLQTRDFVHVSDIVAALLAAGTAPNASGAVCNIGTGQATSLLELLSTLSQVIGASVFPQFGPVRQGDIRHSCADISKARTLLGYSPQTPLLVGLRDTIDWMRGRA
jgi:UDP-glucose 4-epimerase